MLGRDAACYLGKLLQVFHVYACFVGPRGCPFCHAFDSVDKSCQSSNDMIRMAYCRPSDAPVLEFDRVREPLGLGGAHERVVRSIVVSRREKVMPLLGMEFPSFAIARFDMYLARAAHWGQRHSVVVEVAVQVRVG